MLDHDGVSSTHSGNDILLSKGVSSSDLQILITPSSEGKFPLEHETAISIAVSTIADKLVFICEQLQDWRGVLAQAFA